MTEGSGDKVGRILTVRGLIDPEGLGRVMMHEHLLADSRCLFEPPPADLGPDFAHAPVTMANRADIVHHQISNRDDLVLDDEALATEELVRFAEAGGGAVVDATSIGLWRDPEALLRISIATGVHVVMGTGFYVHQCQPPEVERLSEEALADLMVLDIDDRVADSGIRAGHIGEIGCDGPTERELKVLRAAARAQRRTGAMLAVHQVWKPETKDSPHRLLDAVEQAGGDLGRTVLGHMDRTGADPGLQVALLRRGVTIAYDFFGDEGMHARWDRQPPQDIQRIWDVQRLIEAGFVDQFVVAQDICFKTSLVAYGGWGYAHVLRRIVPGFRALGVPESALEAILIRNPRPVADIRCRPAGVIGAPDPTEPVEATVDDAQGCSTGPQVCRSLRPFYREPRVSDTKTESRAPLERCWVGPEPGDGRTKGAVGWPSGACTNGWVACSRLRR